MSKSFPGSECSVTCCLCFLSSSLQTFPSSSSPSFYCSLARVLSSPQGHANPAQILLTDWFLCEFWGRSLYFWKCSETKLVWPSGTRTTCYPPSSLLRSRKEQSKIAMAPTAGQPSFTSSWRLPQQAALQFHSCCFQREGNDCCLGSPFCYLLLVLFTVGKLGGPQA